jgi:hypothetical protein
MNRVVGWAQQNTANQIVAVLALAVALPCVAQSPVGAGSRRDRVVLVSLVERRLAVADAGWSSPRFRLRWELRSAPVLQASSGS